MPEVAMNNLSVPWDNLSVREKGLTKLGLLWQHLKFARELTKF
jgi:hypothetical protein